MKKEIVPVSIPVITERVPALLGGWNRAGLSSPGCCRRRRNGDAK
ncbi:MAG: hypothetical protein QGI86_27020 [Candidatus Poribacteria bacterium]|nr:hypothetical protein [Candidatus Poribacteria bacterium]